MMVVQFDVEIGPDLKIIQPAVQFTEEDFRAICFSSLPERSSSKETRCQFHSFRFNSTTFRETELHGYSLFSQQKTPSSSRGYTQESLVIISRLDYPQLFNACLQLMADIVDHNREFNLSVQDENDQIYTQVRRKIHDKDGFEDDSSFFRKRKHKHSPSIQMLDEKLPVIHTAISNISQWPNPDPNSNLELGFLGTIINLSIPLYESMPLLGTVDLDTSSVNFHSMGSTSRGASKFSVSTSDLNSFSCDPRLYTWHDAPVITATEPSSNWDYLINYVSDIADLYILYEYMLLGKPIVVYANSPHLCSTFISLLVDLIRPIPYAGRIREYVTIHSCPSDMDSGIIGVTNPFLVRGIQNEDTLLFVLSSNSGNSKQSGSLSAPVQYYRTYHNGVGILHRQSTLRQTQSIAAGMATNMASNMAFNSSNEKPDVVMANAPPVNGGSAVPARQQQSSSWTTRFLSKYIPALGFSGDRLQHRHVEKSGISRPILSTFAKLPTSFNAYGTNMAKTHKRTQSHVSEFESEEANREEEAKIAKSVRSARRSILKNRLLYPDQKFLATLTRLISQAQSWSGSPNKNVERSIDFVIRFHFATLTARFLGPLACYLDPMEKDEEDSKPKLAFAQTEFIHDLVSPTTSPRRRDSFRISRTGNSLRRRSMVPSIGSATSNGGNSVSMDSLQDTHSSTSVVTPVIKLPNSPPSVALSPAVAIASAPLLCPITSQNQVQSPPTTTTTSTTMATATAPVVMESAGLGAPAGGQSVSILRNLSRKSLGGSKGGSTVSLISTSSPDHGSPGGGRSSMLSLSSLGIKFPPSSVTLGDSAQGKSSFEENDEEGYNDIFECRSPPALPLQPPPPSQPRHRASFKRFSGRFSLATPQELEPPLSSSPRPKSEDMSMANSVDTENHLYHHHNLKNSSKRRLIFTNKPFTNHL